MVDFKLSPTLSAFAKDRHRWRLVLGPVGSGKTSGVYLTLLTQALEQPVFNGKRLSRCMVIRNTRAQLKDSVIKTMCAMTPPDGVNVVYKEAELSLTVKLVAPDGIPSEITFMFRSLEDENDTQRLLSVELTWVWLSEFSELDIAIAKAAASRCGRFPSKAMGGCTHHGLVGESNFPVNGSDWYNWIEVDRPANVAVFKQPSAVSAQAENVENLVAGYYDDLIEGADPRWLQSYVYCEYPDSLLGKVVFPNFTRETHCGRNLKPIIIGPDSPPLIIGVDAGRNPAAVFCQLQSSGRLNTLAEAWASNVAMDEFAVRFLIPLITKRFAGLSIVVVMDPAGFAQGQGTDLSPARALVNRNFHVVPAPTNNIQPRLAAVDTLLTQHEGLLIDVDHCPQLVKSIARDYIYEANRHGRLAETPTKSHPVSDLCFVAGTLVETPAGVTPIELLRVGDLVKTPLGVQRVLAAACTSESAEVWEWQFSDGSSLEATPGHPVWTQRGLVRLDELEYTDVLLSIRSASWASEKLLVSKSMDCGSGSIPRTSITGARTRVFRFIGTCGRRFMDLCRTGMSFITSTMTQRTTRWRTSRWNTAVNTPDTMPSTESLKANSVPQNSLLLRSSLPKLGTALSKDALGTLSMGNVRGRHAVRRNISAYTAALRTLYSEGYEKKDSVPPPASLPPAASLASTTNSDPVLCAPEISLPTDIAKRLHAVSLVGKLRCQEPKPVYDLTVENEHSFFANGVLVHNCDALQYACLFASGGMAPRVNRMLLRTRQEPARVMPSSRAWT